MLAESLNITQILYGRFSNRTPLFLTGKIQYVLLLWLFLLIVSELLSQNSVLLNVKIQTEADSAVLCTRLGLSRALKWNPSKVTIAFWKILPGDSYTWKENNVSYGPITISKNWQNSCLMPMFFWRKRLSDRHYGSLCSSKISFLKKKKD